MANHYIEQIYVYLSFFLSIFECHKMLFLALNYTFDYQLIFGVIDVSIINAQITFIWRIESRKRRNHKKSMSI